VLARRKPANLFAKYNQAGTLYYRNAHLQRKNTIITDMRRCKCTFPLKRFDLFTMSRNCLILQKYSYKKGQFHDSIFLINELTVGM